MAMKKILIVDDMIVTLMMTENMLCGGFCKIHSKVIHKTKFEE